MRALAIALLLAGCYQDTPEDIPCDGDEFCPTDLYCDSIWTCRSGTPPTVIVEGVSLSMSGPFAADVEIARGMPAQLHIRIANTGDAPTENLKLVATTPACLGQTDIDDRFLDINPDDAAVFDQTLSPMAGCASPQRINYEFSSTYRGDTEGVTFERVWPGAITVKLR
jgi:hypothetical protein